MEGFNNIFRVCRKLLTFILAIPSAPLRRKKRLFNKALVFWFDPLWDQPDSNTIDRQELRTFLDVLLFDEGGYIGEWQGRGGVSEKWVPHRVQILKLGYYLNSDARWLYTFVIPHDRA